MKIKLLILIILLSLSSCRKNPDDEIISKDDNIIDLSDNESGIEKEEEFKDFYKNSSIKSDLYKEYFYNEDLPKEDRNIESYEKDNVVYALCKGFSLEEDIISHIEFFNYIYDRNVNELDFSAILTKDTEVKGNKIDEDIVINFIYDIENEELKSYKEENLNGENTNYIDLDDEDWKQLAIHHVEAIEGMRS